MRHKIMLIGCGGMARAHAMKFQSLSDRMEVAALVDIDREKAGRLAELLPERPPVFTDYRDGLPLCDAVLQALPHHLHCPVTVDCLNAGKHVLAEKPLANTEAECLAMIEAAKRSRKVLMVAYCMRFYPLLREMRRIIREEVYGKCFQLSIWTEQLTTGDGQPWLHDREKLGGGQLFSHGCHYIDLMLWMLGNPVSGCHFGNAIGTPWMPREGTSNVCLKFENGATAYHFGTWGARGTKMGYSFQAHCEKGLIEFQFTEGKLYFRNELAPHDPGVPDRAESEKCVLLMNGEAGEKTTEAETRHFLDCIENGSAPETGPEESLRGLRVIWALYDAEEKGTLADLRGI